MQKTMKAVSEAGGDMTKVDGNDVFPILNMLNAKYFIFPLQGGQTVPIQNPYVYGNAWLVDHITYVNNANEELEQLGKIDLRHAAVADKKFENILGQAKKQTNNSIVQITDYKPNHLTYKVSSNQGGVVVFSEIYYPGWTATVDGKKVELGRVNYVLRALNITAGKHEVILDFHPSSVAETETVAYVGYLVLILLVLFACYTEWKKKKKSIEAVEK
jgi:hypothetical protein